MKIGVISDTHLKGVNAQLIRLYQDYFSDVDMIIHAGDIVSIEVVDFLRHHSTYWIPRLSRNVIVSEGESSLSASRAL